MNLIKVGVMGIAAVAASVLTTVVATADSEVDQLKKENAELRKRLEQIENALSEIKGQLPVKPTQTVTTPAELTTADVAQLKKLATMKDKPVHSSLDLELYGYIKLDAAYDNSRTSIGNYARWVESERLFSDDQFNLTANQTRLGVRIKGPESKDLLTSGLVEIDFYGGGSENKPAPMMRHAYLNAYWPDWGVSLLAGQTFDTISPLWMPTVNYTVGWWQGNIGYRRPQLRLTKEIKCTDKVTAKLELAAARAITGRQTTFGRAGGDTGEDADFPNFQGRASLAFPLLTAKPTVIGVSGHWGQEERDIAPDCSCVRFDTWSINADLTLPVTKWLTLQGEAFMGENLDAYLGGIGQGFNTNRMDVVADNGAWVALLLNPCTQWQFNVGAGFNNPADGDLTTNVKDLDRKFNAVVFGNAWYFFNPNFSVGLEVSWLRTDYLGEGHGDALREQLSLMYKF